MDVLCTDKTGTLTEARIALVGHLDVDGKESERVLTLAAVNSCLGSGIRSPLDQAIVDHCAGRPPTEWTKLDEIPFDFERRCVSLLAERDGKRLLVVKGAPESVLARSGAIDLGDGRTGPLDQAVRDVAPGFMAAAEAPDGVVEAIENPALPFAVGVQWHPEELYRADDSAANLFRAFVAAAARHREERERT